MFGYEKTKRFWQIFGILLVLGLGVYFVMPKDIDTKFSRIQKLYPPNEGCMWSYSFNNGIECNGFARMVFDSLFGFDVGVYREDKRYKLIDESTVEIVGCAAGSDFNATKVKSIFLKSKRGDFVQISGTKGHHSAIVSKVDENGVTLYDCNWSLPGENGMRNLVHERKVSWDKFVSDSGGSNGSDTYGVSVYHAPNYNKKYKD